MLRALFCVLALLAFATRLFSPSGFMPMASATGGIEITLCTGQGPVQMPMPMPMMPMSGMMAHDAMMPDAMLAMAHDQHPEPGKNGHDGEHSRAMDHCPFAGGAAAPALPLLGLIGLLPIWHNESGPIAFALKTGWIARLAAPPPPSSGPPHRLD